MTAPSPPSRCRRDVVPTDLCDLRTAGAPPICGECAVPVRNLGNEHIPRRPPSSGGRSTGSRRLSSFPNLAGLRSDICTLEKHRIYGNRLRYSKLGSRVVYCVADLQASVECQGVDLRSWLGSVLPAERRRGTSCRDVAAA